MPWSSGARYCVVVFLIARASLSLLGWATVGDIDVPTATAGNGEELVDAVSGHATAATAGPHNLLRGTTRWDAAWYVGITEDGYGPRASAAFFPLLPSLAYTLGQVTPLDPEVATVIIANLAFFAALVLLYQLSAREWDDRVARRTVLLVTFYPTSFFFLSPYAESLLLCATVAAFLWCRTDRWVSAGSAGVVAAVARPTGWIVAPALLMEAWQRGRLSSRLVWATLPLIGPAAVVAWWTVARNDPTAPLEAQALWGREPTLPIVTLAEGLAVGARSLTDLRWLPELGDVVFGLVPVAVLAVHWRRLPAASYGVFCAAAFLLPLSFANSARPLLSLSRFVLIAFPVAWLAATALRQRWFAIVLGGCVVGWAGLAIAFIRWSFVA